MKSMHVSKKKSPRGRENKKTRICVGIRHNIYVSTKHPFKGEGEGEERKKKNNNNNKYHSRYSLNLKRD